MMILLLTKSLSFEHDFTRNLNDLGHEVLCSKKFLNDLQTNDYFGMDLNYFDSLILSETISDHEVSKILPIFSNFNCSIYRKTKNTMSIETVNTWKSLGIAGFISQSTHFDELREELMLCNQNEPSMKLEIPNNKGIRLDTLLQSFSNQELQIFQILQESGNKYISRETLSKRLWGEPPTKSKESRLSGIVRSIKRKLSNYGFDATCLETSWGRGYCLKKLKLKNSNVEIPGELKVVES